MSSLVLTLASEEIAFAKRYAQLGFSSESEVVGAALRLLQRQIAQAERETVLENSAELYAQIYAEDTELQELTASACMTKALEVV